MSVRAQLVLFTCFVVAMIAYFFPWSHVLGNEKVAPAEQNTTTKYAPLHQRCANVPITPQP